MIDQIFYPNPLQIQTPVARTQTPKTGATGGKSSFAAVLDGKLPTQGLKFSQHALERLQSRGITINDSDLKKLESAVDSVGRKGGKESLVMLGDNAFVVSVKNRTVVTAIDKAGAQGNVFTNIDSAVVI